MNIFEELEKLKVTNCRTCEWDKVDDLISLCREELKSRIHKDCVHCVLVGLKACCRDCESYFKLIDEVLGEKQ